jgi:hypothetical protein
MAKKFDVFLTDEDEQEIERLNASEAVKLARRKAIIEYRRSQYLYTLRDLEEKGKAIMEELVSLEKSLMLCIQAKRVK